MRGFKAGQIGWGLLLAWGLLLGSAGTGSNATDTGYEGRQMDSTDWFPYQERYAIVVMGGNVAPSTQLYTWYWGDTYGMYQELESYGISAPNIYFLSYGPSADDHPQAVDGESTTNNIRSAYQWAEQVCTVDDLLYVYWVDHGSPTSFQTNDGNMTHAELGTLMQPIACRILGAYNPCYSGAVVDDVSRIGLITTTSQDAFHGNSWGWAGKWRQALGGGTEANPSDTNHDGFVSMTEAYEWICPQSQAAGEHPLFDDNGDGVGHECDQAGFDPHDRTKDGYRGNFYSMDARKLFTPFVETSDPGQVTDDSARMWGELIDTGNANACDQWFDYGPTPDYGEATTPQTVGPGAFWQDVTGLSACTTYHFRACSMNATGSDCGTDKQFTTDCNVTPPVVDTGDASNVGESTVQLWGDLADTGGTTSCQVWFEYGETLGYGLGTVPRGALPGPFSEWVGDLEPATLYNFRACGSNGAGGDCGDNREFVTGDAVEWWDTLCPFRKSLVVDNPLNGYQMPLLIYRQDGHDAASLDTVDCDGHCSPDFADVRFQAGGQELAYWVEAVGESGGDQFARVWIRTNGADTIQLYYGNSYALTKSNGDQTFLFFDDFEVDSRMEYSKDSQTGVHCYRRSDDATATRRVRFKSRLYSIQSANGGGSTHLGRSTGPVVGEDNYVTIRLSYDTNSAAAGLQPGIQLAASDATGTAETSWARETSAGEEYLYEIRLLAGQSATGEITNLHGTTVWSDTLVENVPATLENQLVAHATADGGCALEELTWMADEKRLRSFNMGSDHGCDGWIENWIDWWFVASYTESEPSWASFGPEEQASADTVDCCVRDTLGACLTTVSAGDCGGWIVHECCGDGNANALEDGCESITLHLARDGLVWSDRHGTIGYDVVRGDLGLLLSLGGNFALAVEECLADNRAESSLPHLLEPTPREGYWYLVRGVGATGNMTYAAAVGCDLGDRDQTIDLAVAACP